MLLTRNLLIEHLSLTHLEELESQAQGDNTHVEIASKVVAQQTTIKKDRGVKGSGKKNEMGAGGGNTSFSPSKGELKIHLMSACFSFWFLMYDLSHK